METEGKEYKDCIAEIEGTLFYNIDMAFSNFKNQNPTLELVCDKKTMSNCYDFIKWIKKKIKIPLIVHGGCKSPNDVGGIYNKVKFEGVAISSLFHYHLTKKLKKELIADLKKQKNFSEGNIEYLVNNKGVYSYLYPNTYTIKKFKRELMKTKIKVRL